MPNAERSPAWLRGPLVVAGNWEPLIYRRRQGGWGTDVTEKYRLEHSPALVGRLADLGVNLYITHYFKGFGLILKRLGPRMGQGSPLHIPINLHCLIELGETTVRQTGQS